MAKLFPVIQYEGNNETLVWKHPIEDFNMGSQLIVHESQEAIFFRDGQALDLFGPGRYTLETQQLPILGKLYKLSTGGESVFHSEVYFINRATQMGIKWGTDSKVRLFDPASGLHLEIGASGEFNIRVVDSRRFLLKVVGTTKGFGQKDLLGGNGYGAFRALVMTQAKSYLAQAIKENGFSILEIDAHLMRLSTALQELINEGLAEYGLTMPEFYISRIVTPDDDPNFKRMKEQYAQQYLLVRQEQIRKSEAEAAAARKTVEAQTEAQMKIISAQGAAESLKIQKAAEAEAYRMQAIAEAEEMRIKDYTYQQESARRVGMEAMKNGIVGKSGGSGIGDLAGIGIALGAMGSIVGMTKETMEPIFDSARQAGKNSDSIVDAQPTPETWNCICGRNGLTSKYCPECGSRRPATASAIWDCPCGQKGLSGMFCPECGKKRGE